MSPDATPRNCLRPPTPAVEASIDLIAKGVEFHLDGDYEGAAAVFVESNSMETRDWVESLWGRASDFNQSVKKGPPTPKQPGDGPRNAGTGLQNELLARDGFYCRFCGVRIIRPDVRKHLHNLYPDSIPWGRSNQSQHAGFQASWAQFDHLQPHSLGGATVLDNMAVTCAPCNFGRMERTLEEMNLGDPLLRDPMAGEWMGLEHVLP